MHWFIFGVLCVAMPSASVLCALGIEESGTYQWILNQGKAIGLTEAARRILLLLGERTFGTSDATIQAAIETIDNRPRLKRMALAVLTAASWAEVLQTP